MQNRGEPKNDGSKDEKKKGGAGGARKERKKRVGRNEGEVETEGRGKRERNKVEEVLSEGEGAKNVKRGEPKKTVRRERRRNK